MLQSLVGGGGMLFSCVFANQHSWKNSCNTCHFPLLLLRYIPSISASYSSLKQAKSSLFPPSLLPHISLSTTQGKKLHRQNAAFGYRAKMFCRHGRCHAKHIWKQFVSEAELVCPQSCFLLKCLCAHCPPLLQQAFPPGASVGPAWPHLGKRSSNP